RLNESVQSIGMKKSGKPSSRRETGSPFKPGRKDRREAALFLAWVACSRLDELKPGAGVGNRNDEVFDELLLDEFFERIFHLVGTREDVSYEVDLLKILIREEGILTVSANLEAVQSLRRMLENTRVQHFIRLNVYDGIQYYNKELLETVVDWKFSL